MTSDYFARLEGHRVMGEGEVPGLPAAAVLVALRPAADPNESPWVVLTVRSPHLSLHPGEVALAGGKAEPEDASPIDTALREAREEIGLAPESVRVLTMLAPIVSRLGILVYPVVGVIAADFSPAANEDEVSTVFWVPLRLFLASDAHCARRLQLPGSREPWIQHEFQHDGHRIWGLTANILIQVASIAFAEPPGFAFDYHQYTRPQGNLGSKL